MTLATEASNPLLRSMLALALQLDVPIKFKDESKLMWLIDRFLARLFNPEFMTRFTTTLGSTVYFPSRKSVLENQSNKASTLAHEFVHVEDRRYYGFVRFSLYYLFPQIFALPAVPFLLIALLFGALMPNRITAWIAIGLSLGASVALAACFISTWALAPAAFLIFLAPLPAPGRMKWELRGYTMSLAISLWWYGGVLPSMFEWTAQRFTGADYYFMWPFKSSIQLKLEKALHDIESGKVFNDPLFLRIYDRVKGLNPQAG